MDPVALVIQAAFYILFGVAAWRYARHRTPLELGVVAVFSTTAALFLLSFISTFAPGLANLVRPLTITALVAQPYLIVRLLHQIWTVPRWARWVAFLGFVATTAGVLLLGSRSGVALIGVVAYFGLTESAAAVQFVRLARSRHGAHRLRLDLAGIATGLFGLAIVVVALGAAASAGTTSDPFAQVIGRLLALFAALGYLAAFLPPRWLTGYFHRAAAFDLARQVVSVRPGQGPAVLWGQLALAAESILGATSVRIVDREGRSLEADPDLDPGTAAGRRAPRQAAATASTGLQGREVLIPVLVDGCEAATLTAHLDGQPLFVEDDMAIVSLLASLTAGAVQHDADATKLRATQLALEESAAVQASDARFRVLLEADPNAILATDDAGRVSWATRSSAELFGYENGELIGRELSELIDIPAADRSRAPGPPGSADQIMRVEGVASRADGSTFPVEVALRELDLDGLPTTVAIVADASWRREANEIRDRFVGILSHELRTPITSIYGGAQVLLKRAADLDPDTRTELITGLADESDRLQRMIENLLILDRVERGADFFGPRPVLIQRVLAGVIEHERALWPSIHLELDCPEGLPVVTGDEDQLGQVVRNLLSNAVKYAGAEASIVVRARFEDPWVRVSVADDGPGFPPEEADQLFSLYYRSAKSQAAPGAGIGLYVCRSLVEAMGGTISARSVPGGGAEFAFSLPTYVDVDDLVGPAAETPDGVASAGDGAGVSAAAS
jgi:PAS domain S-box-containing protein